MNVYYHDYLHLDRLLDCQHLASPGTPAGTAHDEMLFVIVHQTYELWFKQILWELDDVLARFAGDELDESEIARVIDRLARVVEIQRVMIAQIDVLETMTPMDFLDFRDLLVPASGFQSMQFRLIENRLGVRAEDRLTIGGARYTERLEGAQRQRVLESEKQPSLHDSVGAWLGRTPFLDEFDFWAAYLQSVRRLLEHDRRIVAENPNLTDGERKTQLAAFEQTFRQYEALVDEHAHDTLVAEGARRWSHRAFQAALFISLYRQHPAIHEPYRMLAALIDVDEGFTAWRYRHAQMTQRMIGRRVGTGGSAGGAYLTRQAERGRAFPDLFALPTFLLPARTLAPLPAALSDKLRFHYQSR
ncbi:MAG: tryptophan 2,3-dioxygenase [Actinomycetota bacterium]|nr:tryptophan 2,3-dioxygenase [Actinomycetota bacterium]